jgi:CRP/FNR family transcriptional regulator, cyclic AMP receptor protein
MTGDPRPALADHPFLRGMPDEFVAPLARAAVEVSYPASRRLFEEGGPATKFWLIRTGHVALDIQTPGPERLIVETIGDGDVIGLSWLTPTPEWQFGAVAIKPTAVFELDSTEVIRLCDSYPALGYQFARRLLAVATRRLQSTRIRMLDLYSAPARPPGAP